MGTGSILHLFLHVAIPLGVSVLFFGTGWIRPFLLMQISWLIDLDHLLATPVYAPDRCSIGFHPLHTTPAAALYVGMLAWQRTRLVAAGLCIHLLLDLIDCARLSALS